MPNRIRTWLTRPVLAAVTAGIAVAFFGAAGAASASTASVTWVATTAMSSWPDGGHNLTGGYWATEQFTRTATLTDEGADVSHSGLESYQLVLNDLDGTFQTNAGVSDPAGVSAALIARAPISGTVSGVQTIAFDAPQGVTPGTGSVPARDSDRAVPTSAWPSLFFPPATPLTSETDVYSYSYFSPQTCETWLDANTDNDGQTQPSAGDITGNGKCPVTVNPVGNQAVMVNTPFSLQMTGSAASSDPHLNWSLSECTVVPSPSCPSADVYHSGLVIDGSGLISGTPTALIATDFVTATATDDYGASSPAYQGTFQLDVTNHAYAGAYSPPSYLSQTPYTTSVNMGWSAAPQAIAGSTSYHYQVVRVSDGKVMCDARTTATHASCGGLAAAANYKWRLAVGQDPLNQAPYLRASRWSAFRVFTTL